MRAEAEARFREFVVARQSALLSTASLLAGDWASGEDLLQTALAKTYLAWPRIRDKAAVEASGGCAAVSLRIAGVLVEDAG